LRSPKRTPGVHFLNNVLARGDRHCVVHDVNGEAIWSAPVVKWQNQANVHLPKPLAGSLGGEPVGEAPLNNGMMFFNHPGQYSERLEKDGMHCRLAGTIRLGSLAPITAPPGAGYRLAEYPIAPAALGGHLGVFSKMFQQSKMSSGVVHYAPACPTTTVGGIGIGFSPDPADIGFHVGDAEYSVFCDTDAGKAVVQSTVYSPASYEIPLNGAVSHYMDDQTGDERLAVQGIIEVLSAIGFPVGSLGNLFLSYVYEFWEPALDYSIAEASDISVILTSTTRNVQNKGGIPYYATPGAASANACTWLITGAGAIDCTKVYVGIVTVTSGNVPTYGTLNDPSDKTLSFGQRAVVRFMVDAGYPMGAGPDYAVMLLFDSIESAVGFDVGSYGLDQVTNPGQFGFQGTTGATSISGSVRFQLRSLN
jgi:hypothetical protein